MLYGIQARRESTLLGEWRALILPHVDSSRGLSEKFECLTDLDSTSTTYLPYSLWERIYALGRDVPPNAEGYKGRLLLGYLLKNDTSGNEHLFRGSLDFCFASS